MTQNETSGKQLFEWIETDPQHTGVYLCRIENNEGGHDERRIGYMGRWILNEGDKVLGWLSPTQPSTGKQLPTDEEIQAFYSEWLETPKMSSVQDLLTEFAKWLRSYEGRGEDKWISVDTPPKEGGRYWCYVKAIGDLGVSYYQWNCSYHERENRWSDRGLIGNVTHWQPLPAAPISRGENKENDKM